MTRKPGARGSIPDDRKCLINLCVTCDPTRAEVVLSCNSIPDTGLYSTSCAVQTLWLVVKKEMVRVTGNLGLRF